MYPSTWVVVFNNFIHFQKFLAATTVWFFRRTIVEFVFSVLSQKFQFYFGSNKKAGGLSQCSLFQHEEFLE